MHLPAARARAALAVAGAAVALAGCGAAVTAGSGSALQSLPTGWHTVRLTTGEGLSYPPSWRLIVSDRGTASAALFNRDGTIRAYLNATPAIKAETLAGWTRFRLHHNAEEGDTHVRLLASDTNVRLDAGRASCVTDQYSTSRSMYRELACVIAPSHAQNRTVLVAAAQPGAWAHERTTLEFAIHRFVS